MIRYNTTDTVFEGYDGSAWGSIGAQFAYTRTSATATASQTTFSATYTAGYVDVYLNGVKLISGTDFTATNGTSVVLTSGAAAGDLVEILAYETFEVANALIAGNNLSDLSSASTARTNLGLVIGTDVQAYDAQLADVAGLTPTDGNIIIGNGTNFITESGATARTSLGLGTIATAATSDYAATANNLSDLASASTALTNLGGAATANNLSDLANAGTARTNLGVAIGTDVQAYDSNLTSFVGTFTLPTTDGTADQVLTTNGSGTLAFADAGGGAWEYITTITPTASTSISAPNIIGSGYEAIRIVIHNLVTSGTYQGTAGSGINMRLATGGSVNTSSVYGSLRTTSQIDGNSNISISSSSMSLNGDWIYPNGDGFNGEILITGLQEASGKIKSIYSRISVEHDSGSYRNYYCTGLYAGGTVTGFQLYTDSFTGTYVATGSIKVYGLVSS